MFPSLPLFTPTLPPQFTPPSISFLPSYSRILISPPTSHPLLFLLLPHKKARKQRKLSGKKMTMSQLWPSSDAHDHLLFLLALLLDDILSFISLLTSHPLHSAYLLFFSPYLLHLLSFLSPLLVSTSLLLLSLLTVSPSLNCTPDSFLLRSSSCRLVLGTLRSKFDEEATVGLIEQLTSMVLAPTDNAFGWEFYKHSGLGCQIEHDPVKVSSENCGETEVFESHCGIDVQLANNAGEFCELTGLNCKVEDEPVRPCLENCTEIELLDSHCEIVGHNSGENNVFESESDTTGEFYDSLSLNSEVKEDPVKLCSDGSEEIEVLEPKSGFGDQGTDDDSKSDSFMPKTPSRTTEKLTNSSSMRRSESLQRDGSMRKEKEWKRTLACKLYEERMTFKLCEETTATADEGEEMDLLWEAYEADANKADRLKKSKSKSKSERKEEAKNEAEEEEEEDEDDGMVRQFCCLQALRLSTGKMNLGVGKPSFMKLSKAFKGIGLFHKSGRRSRKA